MHHLLITIGAAALAFALWPGPAAAETSLGSLTNPGVPVVNAGYVRRYRTYYARKDYRSRCEGGGWAEIRELQRYWPQTLWPPSMRCFPIARLTPKRVARNSIK
jgi:hypothetical protein